MFLNDPRYNRKYNNKRKTNKPRVQKTYSQDWEAYNLAQTNEKSKFLEMLFHLCEDLDEPPRKKGAGRNRIPLKDMVFSVVYKVYSGVSGRRFMSDLKSAREIGFISKTPHFNSLFNYLETDEMGHILKEMITRSALPLRALETEFAVDASGFSKGTRTTWMNEKYSNPHLIKKADWLKCHLMCGVLTNVVTSVEITNGTSADSPQFKPLVNQTAKHFKIREVSADKAYLSVENLHVVNGHGGVPFIPFKKNSTPDHHTNDLLWKKMYYFFKMNNDKFREFYHKRSNSETVFYMVKQKFGERLKSKTTKAQVNELLCKILCHNLCCLTHAFYEFDINMFETFD